MAYIYKIENDINGKIYIGKTEFSIKKRFKEHCNDAFRERNEKRPLYMAMRKYGIEHFHISLIEETNDPEKREVYWIEKEQSFKKGYNATMGGDGTKYIDYEKVILTYQKVQNCKEVAKLLEISADSVRNILKSQNITIKTPQDINKEKYSKIVAMFNKNNYENPIQVFSSLKYAARFLIEKKITSTQNIKGVTTHISRACSKERRNAYGYHWEFL